MNKYELGIKIDQIKKLAAKKEYAEAAAPPRAPSPGPIWCARARRPENRIRSCPPCGP